MNGNGQESERHLPAGLIGLLAAGAAIGATGALVARRRNRAKWAEYEPATVQADAKSLVDVTRSGDIDDHPRGATKFAHWAKGQTKSAVGTVRGKIHDATGDHDSPAGTVTPAAADAKRGDVKDRVNEGTSHLAGKADARLNETKNRPADATSRATDTAGKATGRMAESAGNADHRTDAAGNASGRMPDEVDELLRSAKNGRM